MIGPLISLALRVGTPQRFAKAVAIASVAAALLALLAIGKCTYDQNLIKKHDAEQAAEMAPVIRSADANAAEARLSDQERNRDEEDAERAAVAPLPDAGLSDRQRSRACAILRRQAAERGHASPAGC